MDLDLDKPMTGFLVDLTGFLIGFLAVILILEIYALPFRNEMHRCHFFNLR